MFTTTPTIPAPLISTPGMADPHALIIDNTCWLFTGHDIGHGVSDWVMPDWRIYKSTDLQSWDQVGTIDPKDTYMGAGSTDCWAGDIVYRNGLFYWFFSDRSRSIGVMVADKPEGPYKDLLGKPLVDSFDPTVFIDEDDTPYLVWGMKQYRIARLDSSMTKLAEEPRILTIDPMGDFPLMDKNSLHKHNGLYYLSCSGYYATSHHIYGPYKFGGSVGQGWQLESHYAHGDFFTWQDQWYHVWCRYRDRRVDRVRDCFMAPTKYLENGAMLDDLSGLPNRPEDHGWYE
jgi:arabinoxylan arabinofuranohydrolase